tara:strand:- start:2336 stop:2560 length:225 start_codon:yes stop_codon:yes gene_type:complete
MNNIKKVLREKGLRANHIAELVGISDTDLSNYIAERRKPNHERLIAMTKAIGCSITDLYPNAKRIVTYDLGLDQ